MRLGRNPGRLEALSTGYKAMKVSRRTKLEDLPDLLTPEEFRVYLGIGRTTVYELIRSGEMRVKRFGRRVWIPKDVLRQDEHSASSHNRIFHSGIANSR